MLKTSFDPVYFETKGQDMQTKKNFAFICNSGDRRRASVAVLKLLKIQALILLTTGICGFGSMNPVHMSMAASCNITFSGQREINVDDITEVELMIEGDVVPGIFEGYVSYDPDVLEFVSGPDCIAGGEGTLRISDMGYESNTLARKYILNFRAVKIGTCEISMRGTPEIYEADLGYLMSVSSSKLSIEVKAAVKASSDASLGLIRVNPGTLQPAFDSGIYEYSVFLDHEITEIYISAAPADGKASVKIEGNTTLAVGQNRILILVTAEDGTVAKYVIYVARAEEGSAVGEMTEGDDTPSPPGDALEENRDNPGDSGSEASKTPQGWVFYATETDGEIFVIADSRYKVSRNLRNVTIPDSYRKTSIIISGNTITAYAPADSPDSDFLLLVLEKEGFEPALYSFDRVEKTIQRFDDSRIIAGNRTGSSYATIEEEELVKSYEKSLGTMTMVIAILSGVCMLLLIIVIRMAVKNRNELD